MQKPVRCRKTKQLRSSAVSMTHAFCNKAVALLLICSYLLLCSLLASEPAEASYNEMIENQTITESFVTATIPNGAAHVELVGCKLTTAGLAEICKNVWELKISRCTLFKESFSSLPVNKVTALVFNNVTFAPGALSGLKSFPNLTGLSLSECKLEDDSDLRFLRDVGKSVTDQTLDFLGSYARLTQLYLALPYGQASR